VREAPIDVVERLGEVDDLERVALRDEDERVAALVRRRQVGEERLGVVAVGERLEVDLLLEELRVEGERALQVLAEVLRAEGASARLDLGDSERGV